MTRKQFQGDAAASPWAWRAIVLMLILWVSILGAGVLRSSAWDSSSWFKVVLLVAPTAIFIGSWLVLMRKRNRRVK